DARQPYPLGEEGEEVLLTSRQGIGSPNPDAREEDKIKLTLGASASGLRAISHNCWSLCATGIELDDTGMPALLPNKISCIKESPIMSDTYQIILERPISGRHWTRIRYLGGEAQEVSYASLPANANGDYVSTPVDILDHIDSCVNQVRTPPHGVYSCDIDRDGFVNAADNQRLVDLLQGEGNFIVWNGQPLSINTCASGYGSWGGSGGGGGGPPNCTDPESCGGGIEPQAMVSGGGIEGDAATFDGAGVESGGAVDENALFADWFVNYLTTANPVDSSAEDEFRRIVDSLTQWCVGAFTAEERAALAARLSDPTLDFASEVGRREAANVAATVSE
ncbi:MAG: hypothetical protein Q7R41_15015, partial [Phycisphaerales bacterium]|nr:hypothetical protein [Phycisphaerales bacterium]